MAAMEVCPTTTMQWMYHDADHADVAHLGRDWSGPKSLKDAFADLAHSGDLSRRINVLVTCCVADLAQSEESSSIILRAADSASSSSIRLEASSALERDSFPRSFPIDSGSHALTSLTTSSSSLSCLSALRTCLSGDSETAMVRWMWDDAGLSRYIRGYRHVARLNPLRWSKWLSLQSATRDLESYMGSGRCASPVRLVVLPNVMTSFVTRADNATDAWLALDELLGRTDALTGRTWKPLSRENSFLSCADFIGDDDQELIEGMAPSGSSCIFAEMSPAAPKSKLSSSNPNKISHFTWLQELLERITMGSARDMVTDLKTKQAGTPLFIVAGACPNNFCGMQAVLYSQVAGNVDFWWIKPQAADPNSLEQSTLNHHLKGQFKNTAVRSRNLYAPLAEKFTHEECSDGNLRFGVDESGRAYIEEKSTSGKKVRMLLYLVWQEKWSSLWSSTTFIEGKILYQRCELGDAGDTALLSLEEFCDGTETRLFSRQYRIESGNLALAPGQDEEEIFALLPSDTVQDMYAWSTSKK